VVKWAYSRFRYFIANDGISLRGVGLENRTRRDDRREACRENEVEE